MSNEQKFESLLLIEFMFMEKFFKGFGEIWTFDFLDWVDRSYDAFKVLILDKVILFDSDDILNRTLQPKVI